VDLTNVKNIKALLGKHGLRPNKVMGQNFLVDKNALAKLIEAAEIKRSDVVVEVGSGLGTITAELARHAKKVIAVEKDTGLIPILQETTKNLKNVKVVQGDILKIENLEIDWKLEIGNWKLVGNIPYYLTAPLIKKFLESDNPPKLITFTVQKEMAERICASPPSMSILAVSVQVYASPEIAGKVSRSSFWPMPAVDSAVLKISKVENKKNLDKNKFFGVLKAGFSSPRKQLVNNLSRGLGINAGETKKWLSSSGIDPKRRAETLEVGEWEKLTKSM